MRVMLTMRLPFYGQFYGLERKRERDAVERKGFERGATFVIVREELYDISYDIS